MSSPEWVMMPMYHSFVREFAMVARELTIAILDRDAARVTHSVLICAFLKGELLAASRIKCAFVCCGIIGRGKGIVVCVVGVGANVAAAGGRGTIGPCAYTLRCVVRECGARAYDGTDPEYKNDE